MAQQTSPVVQKRLIGVFSDWSAVAEGADQKLALNGVGELKRLLEAKVEATFGLECTMRLRPGHFPDVTKQELLTLRYGELPPTPPVLVFEPSPNVGVVDARVSQLRDEKELADLKLQTASVAHQADFAKLMAAIQNLSGELASIQNDYEIEKQCHVDNDERHEKRIASLEKRVGYQNQKIENLKHELKDTKDELKDTKDELKITKDELKITKDELKITKDELKITKDELKITRDELKITKDELKITKDELRETQGTVKKLEEECDFFTYLHLRSLLDESRRIIAFAFGVPKWRTFIEDRHDKKLLATDIDRKFPGSALSPACIEYLCDDANPLRFHGNNVAHHKDFAKMKKAIDKVKLPAEHEHWHRQHLRSLYQFITTAKTSVDFD